VSEDKKDLLWAAGIAILIIVFHAAALWWVSGG